MALFLLLVGLASALSHQRQSAERRQQRHYQEAVRKEWLEQPDRHPHRVAHFGNFAFKPRSLLASFDPGVEAHVGRVQYLEAHRQNAMNFAEAGNLTAVGRLGELSPAFLAGPLLSLIIVLLGHGLVVEDRELGRLRMLLAQGVKFRSLWWAKGTGLALAILPFALVVPLAQGVIMGASPRGLDVSDTEFASDAIIQRSCLLFLAMMLHALLWILVTMLFSALAATRKTAVGVLLCLWLCSGVVIPRASAGLASFANPLPTRSEFNARLGSELEKLGDSHNESDPAFRQLREDTLRRYGVGSVESLPVNYKGIVMAKGEEHSSQVFQSESKRFEEIVDMQQRFLAAAAWFSPSLSWHDISARLCGTDLDAARCFAQQAEAWRYGFVQKLNTLQRDHVSYAQNGSQRLDKSQWAQFEDFCPRAPSVSEILRDSVGAWLRLLLSCGVIAVAGALWAERRRLA